MISKRKASVFFYCCCSVTSFEKGWTNFVIKTFNKKLSSTEFKVCIQKTTDCLKNVALSWSQLTDFFNKSFFF